MITAGVDIGSSSSKAVILENGTIILSQAVIPVGTGTSGPVRVLEQALARACLEQSDIDFIVATGYGRTNFPAADHQVSEITCHARGVFTQAPQVQTIIDIGGQDAKAIRISPRGQVLNFVMNDKCAAGTGRFLDVMSRVLEIEVAELADLGAAAQQEASISSTCTVFAESEVISQLAGGTLREDVAAGSIRSVVRRVAGLAKRVGAQREIIMTGGVSLNWLAVKFMGDELQLPVTAAKDAQLTGALGAAIIAWEMRSKG
ncbi:MAG: acyl-CoA dehydratase activase [Methylocystaceae bacterium]